MVVGWTKQADAESTISCSTASTRCCVSALQACVSGNGRQCIVTGGNSTNAGTGLLRRHSWFMKRAFGRDWQPWFPILRRSILPPVPTAKPATNANERPSTSSSTITTATIVNTVVEIVVVVIPFPLCTTDRPAAVMAKATPLRVHHY